MKDYYTKLCEFSELKGKFLNKIIVEEDLIIFEVSDNEKYKMNHDQDCCETVHLEDICGDLDSLIGSEILIAEKRTNSEEKLNPRYQYGESFTYTFYELATIKGSVTIRWFGESNGYYSEEVGFQKIIPIL